MAWLGNHDTKEVRPRLYIQKIDGFNVLSTISLVLKNYGSFASILLAILIKKTYYLSIGSSLGGWEEKCYDPHLGLVHDCDMHSLYEHIVVDCGWKSTNNLILTCRFLSGMICISRKKRENKYSKIHS